MLHNFLIHFHYYNYTMYLLLQTWHIFLCLFQNLHYSNFPKMSYHLLEHFVLFLMLFLFLLLLFLYVLRLNPIVLQTLNYLYNLFLLIIYLLVFVLGYMLHKYMDILDFLLFLFLMLIMELVLFLNLYFLKFYFPLFLLHIFLSKSLHFHIHFLTFFVLVHCILFLLILSFHLNNMCLKNLYHFYKFLYIYVSNILFYHNLLNLPVFDLLLLFLYYNYYFHTSFLVPLSIHIHFYLHLVLLSHYLNLSYLLLKMFHLDNMVSYLPYLVIFLLHHI